MRQCWKHRGFILEGHGLKIKRRLLNQIFSGNPELVQII